MPRSPNAFEKSAAAAGSHRISGPPLRGLPSELHLLFVGPEEPSWTLLTLQLDRYGCTSPRFRWCPDLSAAARIVHQETYDCIVIDDSTAAPSAVEDAAPLAARIAGLRAGGCLDPLLVLSDRVDDDWLEEMADAGCELLITRHGWRSRAVTPWIRCAIARHTREREQEEMGVQTHVRREREASESRTLLEQRRRAVQRLLRRPLQGEATLAGPEEFEACVGLLRAAVLMGADQLEHDMAALAALLARKRYSAADVLALHLEGVQELLRGLGGRSAQHVIQQTDLVLLETLIRFSDSAAAPTFARDIDDHGVELETDGAPA